MPWFDRYFTPVWEKRFRNESRKLFFNHPELIDDAFQNAWIQLLENLQSSSRHDVTDPYVLTSFKHLLIDDYRQQFGRCRPYEWVNRLGVFWKRVAKLLCQDHLPASIIAEQVCCKSADNTNDSPCLEKVDDIVIALKSQAYCSTEKVQEEQWPEDFEQGDKHSPEQELPDNEIRLLLKIILQDKSAEIDPDSLSEHIVNQWQGLSSSLNTQLNDDERLLLTLVYIEGYPVTRAAKQLNKKPHTLRYQLRQTLDKILQILTQHDISMALLD